MSFIESIKQRAAESIKTIILPEGEDRRVLEAASKVVHEGFAKIILVGNREQIERDSNEFGINLDGVQVIDIATSERKQEYIDKLFELRQAKGMTIEEATKLIEEPIYFGMMMLKLGEADGLVSGAAHSTSNTLRPALQILKTAPNTKLVSAFFVMCVPDCEYGENGIFVYGDSGLVENPNADELSEIAISSAKSFENLVGAQPKVAMLSYSTYGSAKSELTEKVIEATRLAKEKAPELLLDGELQVDAAIIPEITKIKAPESPLEGKANVFVFPDLNAGNIAYKITQRLGKAEAYGPLCQGIAKPVNDLSRGCSSDDIAGVVGITAVQAQQN